MLSLFVVVFAAFVFLLSVMTYVLNIVSINE